MDHREGKEADGHALAQKERGGRADVVNAGRCPTVAGRRSTGLLQLTTNDKIICPPGSFGIKPTMFPPLNSFESRIIKG